MTSGQILPLSPYQVPSSMNHPIRVIGCLLCLFPFAVPTGVESVVTLIISQWATGSSNRSKLGIVILCTLRTLTPSLALVTLIIKMHLFRQSLPWFMPGKNPQTPAFIGWGQSGRQHFTYLCHSSPMQSLSCQWEKTGPFRDYSSPRRRRCLNWAGWIALQQSLSDSTN